MNETIDLTGDDKPAATAAMEIDANPFLQPTAPKPGLGSSTAAPALGPNGATAAPPVPATAGTAPPHNGLDAAANEALRLSQRDKKPSKQRMLMDQIGEQPQHLRMNRKHGKFSLKEMQDHLETISIGLRPSDPTVIELPDELPPPIHPANTNNPDIEVINLAEWTQERLNTLAATTITKDPFSSLLDMAPPAPKDRLGRFTGQQHREKIMLQAAKSAHIVNVQAQQVEKQKELEKKREKKVVSVALAPQQAAPPPQQAAQPAYQGGGGDVEYVREDMITTLHKYLSVGVDVPWSLLGKKFPLRANGIDIQVLSLWTAVQNLGGFGAVGNKKLWNAVGRELGLDTKTFHSVHMFRDAYAKYLLPYEVFLRHQREDAQRAAWAAAGPLPVGGGGNYFLGN